MTRLFAQLDAIPSDTDPPFAIHEGQLEHNICYGCRQTIRQPGDHVDPATGWYVCEPKRTNCPLLNPPK